ncbi:MAG: YkgJ family cysteine cluster protein [Thermoanaerobaculia bacterium]
MECRSSCGACCIAPSISSAIPGMPDGKPAGVRCIHLTGDLRCAIFEDPARPRVCGSLRPAADICGESAAEALALLDEMELITRRGA